MWHAPHRQCQITVNANVDNEFFVFLLLLLLLLPLFIICKMWKWYTMKTSASGSQFLFLFDVNVPIKYWNKSHSSKQAWIYHIRRSQLIRRQTFFPISMEEHKRRRRFYKHANIWNYIANVYFVRLIIRWLMSFSSI